MVTINIGRKEAIFFGAVILVFVVAGLVVAYNSGNPSVHGHDANEIANLPVGNGSGGLAFGDYGIPITVTTSLSSSETNEFTPILATTDLLLVATCRQTTDGWNVISFKGYTGDTSNPNVYRGAMSIARDWGSETLTGVDSFTMFVKEGDYYVVRGTSHMYSGTTRTYITIPIITGGSDGGSTGVVCGWEGIKAISGAAGPEDDGCFCCRSGNLKWMRMVSGAACASETGC